MELRLLYLTQWFDPEPNVIKGPRFVRALGAAGFDVTVVTGLPNYPTGKIYPGYRFRPFQRERIDGAEVERLPLYPSHSGSSLGRALNFLSFFLSVLVYGLVRGGRFDLFYVYHPPITVGLAAALFGPLRRRRFVLEIQDLWPDTVVVSGMRGTSRMERLLTAACNFTYHAAERIIVQSEGMRSRLIERGVPSSKIDVVRNWADGEEATIAPVPAPPQRPLQMVYGGNLGRMQALETVIRAAHRASDAGIPCELTLVGDGIEAEALRETAREIAATNVRFEARMSQDEVRARFAAADVLVLHLASDPLFDITIPSKTQFYLASAKPILAGIGGEAATILRQSGGAIVTAPDDVAKFAEAIAEMAKLTPAERTSMGLRGRAYYDANLSFAQGIERSVAAIRLAAAP